MNCVFVCVFCQEMYVEMFFIMLYSILTYGRLTHNTEILVYTTTDFMNLIKKCNLFNETFIKFEINDKYNDIDKACKSRLDLFDFPSTAKYDKILYLDTDIIVKDSIDKLFAVCEKDLLYVLEESAIDDINDWHGYTLFGNEVHDYEDKSAFTSGILLFNNCENMKMLFSKIREDIVNRPYYFSCYDQPYIIYNAFKYRLYNNKVLETLVVNNDENIHSDKVIHHFPGIPGFSPKKIQKMQTFLLNMSKNI